MKCKAKRIRKGCYEYRGYIIQSIGYYLNAAENILRGGISELWSGSKTVSDTASRACTQESHVL